MFFICIKMRNIQYSNEWMLINKIRTVRRSGRIKFPDPIWFSLRSLENTCLITNRSLSRNYLTLETYIRNVEHSCLHWLAYSTCIASPCDPISAYACVSRDQYGFTYLSWIPWNCRYNRDVELIWTKNGFVSNKQ